MNSYMGGLFRVLWSELGMTCNILSERTMLQIGLVLVFRIGVHERIKGLSLGENGSPFT